MKTLFGMAFVVSSRLLNSEGERKRKKKTSIRFRRKNILNLNENCSNYVNGGGIDVHAGEIFQIDFL